MVQSTWPEYMRGIPKSFLFFYFFHEPKTFPWVMALHLEGIKNSMIYQYTYISNGKLDSNATLYHEM